MAKQLANQRSPLWAFMERFEVPNYDDDGIYLTRWRVIQTPWFGLFLHRFTGPDPRETFHDHPFSFFSFMLRGGYVERRLDSKTRQVDENHVVKWFNRVRAGDAHSIRRLLRNPTWSLLLVGPRVREWGYVEPYKTIPGAYKWTPFNVHAHNREFTQALKRRKAESK